MLSQCSPVLRCVPSRYTDCAPGERWTGMLPATALAQSAPRLAGWRYAGQRHCSADTPSRGPSYAGSERRVVRNVDMRTAR